MHTEAWIQDAWDAAARKIAARTSRRIGAEFPHGSHDGRYQVTAPSYWTAGFWPGLLWLLYRDGGEPRLKQLAEACEERMDEVLADVGRLDHDMGFMWTLTSLANWQITGSAASARRAMTAASHLAGRFNINGRFIRAWNHPERTGWAIIDCLMNLPLLHWAAKHADDPRFRHIATAHAETAVRHFIRPDGSAHHIVRFDPETGERLGTLGGQGYADGSAWARGAAWAIYGAALSHAHTGRAEFRDASERAAAFFLANLPEDRIPYWDFRLPAAAQEQAPKDSSAAAIAASGLLDLAAAVHGDKQAEYREQATAILRSLTDRYRAGDDEEAILLHGTGNLPMGQNVDRPLIYGDFFYMEALAKLRGHSSFWSPQPQR
ncbi:glycoside hydrolase family 88 protein [Paenibacillus cymbidii]|uniref:glycoside hydrolase family 88 protein n=1 Tax=Paenibacillus cymbidii TaxID=1639034 RepID=UPI00108097D9|nr:glycoside hydrolase family 88 protein [Paenibacillus cymbidii]